MNEQAPEREPEDEAGADPLAFFDDDDDSEVLTMNDSVYRGGRRGGSYDGATGEFRAMGAPARKRASAGVGRADITQAAKDSLLLAHGVPVPDAHPMTIYPGDGAPYSLFDMSEALLQASGHELEPGADTFRTTVRALSTADFPAATTDVWRSIAAARQSPQLAKVLQLTRQLTAPDYREVGFSMVDISGLRQPSRATTGAAEYIDLTPEPTGEQIAVHSLHARIAISRQAIVNDSAGLFAASIDAVLRAAASIEMESIVGLLLANANLQHDAAPVFHDDHGNQLAAANVDGVGYLAALRALRRQKTEAGDPADSDPAVLLVSADAEGTALETIKKLPANARPAVLATAHLTGTQTWFLMASPDTHPVIGRTRLENAPMSGVSFHALEPAEEHPGLWLPLTFSVGHSILSRIGCVRVGGTE
jgi:hypothetical protein